MAYKSQKYFGESCAGRRRKNGKKGPDIRSAVIVSISNESASTSRWVEAERDHDGTMGLECPQEEETEEERRKKVKALRLARVAQRAERQKVCQEMRSRIMGY